MSAVWTCEQVQENAAELSLGLTVGPARADALAHLERCDACRSLVGDLTRVVDHLLLTGPVEEPPHGFEGRVLERLESTAAAAGGAVPLAATPPRRRHRPRRAVPTRPPGTPRRHTARLAALAAAVVLVLAGAVVLVRDRPTTTSNEAVREAPMVTPEGKNVGKVDLGGYPSTVFVALPGWYWGSGSATPVYRLRVVLADGSRRDLGPVALDAGGVWGQVTNFDPDTVRSVALLDASGHQLCHAHLTTT